MNRPILPKPLCYNDIYGVFSFYTVFESDKIFGSLIFLVIALYYFTVNKIDRVETLSVCVSVFMVIALYCFAVD